MLSILFSTEKETASRFSQISYQPLKFSNISVATSTQYSESHFTNYFSSIWWPSLNLYISLGISPKISTNDISIYYQSSIGYTPNWAISERFNSTVSLGMHRYRFSDTGNYRWFHFAVLESIRFLELDWNLNWIYLFDTHWEHHQFQMEMAKTIKDLYRFHLGVTVQLLNKIEFTPTIKFSLAL